jgi:hypothetical protein
VVSSSTISGNTTRRWGGASIINLPDPQRQHHHQQLGGRSRRHLQFRHDKHVNTIIAGTARRAS